MKRRSDLSIEDRRTPLPNWRPLFGVKVVILLTLVAGMARRTEQSKAASDTGQLVSPSILWHQVLPRDLADPCLTGSASIESRGVAVGPDENPVAVGQAGNPVTVLVAKFDHTTGERIWCSSFPVRATSGRSTYAVPLAEVGGVAIDSSGEIFIGGHGRSGPSPSPGSPRPGPTTTPPERYFVTKCSDAGICAPTVTFINPPIVGAHDETIGGIAVGPDNNPVLTGFAQFAAKVPNQTRVRLLTVKVSGSTLEFLRMADAPASLPGRRSHAGVAVDPSNNVFVTGITAATFKYDSWLSPMPLWTTPIAAARIALSSSEPDVNLAVLGITDGAISGSHQFVVTRIDPETGGTLWIKAYGIGSNDVVHDVALDASGNIFVVGDHRARGVKSSSGARDGLIVNLSPTGEVSWTALFPFNRSTGDSSQRSFFGVAVGPDQNPVVSGYSDVQPGRPRRGVDVLKYGLELPNGFDGQGDPGEERGRDRGEASLVWDEPANPAPQGFWVCIEERVGSACQDVGLPNARVLASTPPGSLTYSVPLSMLTSFTPHARRISVVAYNEGGASPTSEQLSVRYSDLHKTRHNR